MSIETSNNLSSCAFHFGLENASATPEANQELMQQALAIVKVYQGKFENHAETDYENYDLFSGRKVIFRVMDKKKREHTLPNVRFRQSP